MSKLIALHDRVILKQLEDQEKVVGGIIIPDTGKERSNFFEIIAVGPGKINEFTGTIMAMQSKIGDKVVVPKAVVRQILLDGDEYWVTREIEIEAVINDQV